ncbi:MAG: hypothetical protein DHS20C11_24880 [Lysobacteraceae bacterium]|nr:MAG: hypothetical protein DHS20C11_24880 [Xanthomonadaceae bacterium]
MSDWKRPFATMVQDDFFDDPNMIREWALAQPFYASPQFNKVFNVNETWPGRRAPSLTDTQPGFVSELVDQILTNVMRLPPCDYKANCSFQMAFAGDGDSWIHRDDKMYIVAGLIYLTPDAPLNGGTVFYQQVGDNEFDITDRVANRFNRLLLFDSQVFHKSDQYFGDNLNNARLTLPFFIDFKVRQDVPQDR